MSTCSRVSFFLLWAVLNVAGGVALCWNVKWHWLGTWETVGAALIMAVLITLHIGVMESLTVSVFTLIFCGDVTRDEIGNSSTLTMLFNYNVLALSPGDVDEGMEKMYHTYMDNLTDHVAAVYLSATGDGELRNYETLVRDKYRAKIRGVLEEEGAAFINRDYAKVNYFRQINIWRKLEDKHGLDYVRANYSDVCEKMAVNFMCIHRVSRVLRKCGQYQDLMLLSEGRFMAFTYTDPEYYGIYARPYGEPMFYDSEDVRNIHGRNFDYTFVLDCDSRVPTGVAHTLLGVAAGRPDKAIIQPAIKLEAGIWDTIFMNLEDLRQRLGEPTTNALARVFTQCGFYGKALVNNKLYIERIIGNPDNLVEAIPVDVLSHDTYEAAILKPHFTRNAAILESPTYNYLAWNSRQRRWNLGDLIVAMYFYPKLIGAPIRALQRCVQRKRYFRPRVRTPLKMDTVTAYIANSSLRSMFTKPLWLVLVLMHGFIPVPTYYHWLPVIVVLVIICVVSKLPLFMRCHKGILYLLPELLSSICQYTPEIIAGFIRFFRVLIALIRGRNDWVPQRKVEEEFDTVNPCKMFVYSYRHLWGYAVLAVALMVLLVLIDIVWNIYPLNSSLKMILIYFDITVIFCLPLYCSITSLRICPCACCPRGRGKDSVSDVESSLSSSDSGGAMLHSDRDELLKHYTSTKIIDIVKPGRATLKSRIPLSARVFFRQLKNYAGQIAENRASWFTQRQTKPSDSFEFRVRPPSSGTISSINTRGASRFIPEQHYVEMPQDYFKVTTIGPRPEHQAVVRVEHEEGSAPARPPMWKQWQAPLHASWLDVSETQQQQQQQQQRNEITLTVEPGRSDNITLVEQRKVYYDQYGSYDTLHPLNEFPDTGKVFTSRKLVRNHVTPNPSSHVFADIHTIERSFPTDHIYTEVNERSRDGRLYLKHGEAYNSSTDRKAFHVHGPRSELYTVIHNFEEQPLLRTNLAEIHVFNQDTSLAPPIPPKSPELLEEWRQVNTLQGHRDNIEVTFRVTTDESRRGLSQSWPNISEVPSWSDATNSGKSETRLERIAEEIYAEARGKSTGKDDVTDVKRRHSFDQYDGEKQENGLRKASTLSYRNNKSKGKEVRTNSGSLETATIRRSWKGGTKIKKTSTGNNGNYSRKIASIVTQNANHLAGSGLQGTIVAYNPLIQDGDVTSSATRLEDGQRWFRSEKVYQTGDPPPRPEFAITFQPTSSGLPGTHFQEVSQGQTTLATTSSEMVNTSQEVVSTDRKVVSGLEVDRWMHLDVAPRPPPNFLPVSHKIKQSKHVKGVTTIESRQVRMPATQVMKTETTAFNRAELAPIASTSHYEEIKTLTSLPVTYQTSENDQVTVKTEVGDPVSVVSISDKESDNVMTSLSDVSKSKVDVIPP